MFTGLVQRGYLVAVITLIMVVLGLVATLNIPIQMIPDLEVRTISIKTGWPGATPQDIEKEVLIEQEERLRTVPNLQRLVSSASFGEAKIELEFPFEIDLNQTLIDVMNALSRVPSYPQNVNQPRVFATSFSSNSFMFFRVTPLPGNPNNIDMTPMYDFINDQVVVRMETVEGISSVVSRGGSERQIQIFVDPSKLAEQGLTLPQVRTAIRARNEDVSGGEIESGKRSYLLRTIGRFRDIEALKQLIISRQGDAVVRLADIANVEFGHYKVSGYSYTNGEPAIVLMVRRQAGSNVIDIKNSLMPKVAEINREVLNPAGLQMSLIADDVGYVEASIKNVWTNLLIGAALASLVLFLFLRSSRLTLIAIIGIPVCAIAAFLGLMAADRTINVISLAGVAFAIGMTLDNSIVVLESIEQSLRKGLSRWKASIEGVRKVWPAVLASSLTTVLVFLPILFISEEAGQLYSDIAIAISASIIASMLVAIAVVPAAMARAAKEVDHSKSTEFGRWHGLIVGRVNWLLAARWRQWGMVFFIVASCTAIIGYLTPPAEYLPEGEEPKLFASMSPPTGYNLQAMEKIGMELKAFYMPYLQHDPAQFERGETDTPAMQFFNLGIAADRIRIITSPKNPKHIQALMDAVDKKFKSYVGMRSFVSRGSIISSNNGGTRSISLDISGPSQQTIYQVANLVEARAKQVLAKPRVRSNPRSLSLSQPVLEVHPYWDRLAEMGISNSEIGFTVASMTDGAFVDELFLQDDKIDIYLYGNKSRSSELDDLEKMPIYTPTQQVLPLSALAEVVESVGAATIRRVDGARTVTLNIIPPQRVPLESGVEIVSNDVIGYLRDRGEIPANVTIRLSGAADQLQATKDSLSMNYLVALLLIYLILVAILSHWQYPLLIMTTIPLGIASGIIGLWLMNSVGSVLPSLGLQAISQSFDMITMLGFLVLMGTVVNNPILIVHQAIHNMRDQAMAVQEAVSNAVALRLRPIAMTTLTTVFGLAPLVLIPGEGTELYRGLGVIVLFGLIGAAIVTLTFLPSLLMILLSRRAKKERRH